MTNLRLRLRLLGIVATSALAACGGGGGGSGGGSSPPPAPPPPDSQPDAFTIAPASNALRGTTVDSSPITISGINTLTAAVVVGGEISVGGGPFTSTAGSVSNAQTIVVRVTASTTPGATAEATLTVGGVSATFTATTSTDATAPTATVIFPTAQSRTSADRVIVRGTATDSASAVRSVRVNGVEATSADAFATWTATVPLTPGANTLTIDAQDTALNRSAAAPAAAITRSALIGFVEGIAYDAARGRVLASDTIGSVLLAIDLSTGLRTVIAKNPSQTANDRLLAPSAITLLAGGTHALVLDRSGPPAIMRVELATGARTIVSGRGVANLLNDVENATWMSVDEPNGQAYVLGLKPQSSPPEWRIIRVDLATGTRTVFSDASTPPGPNMYPNPVSLALDAVHNRLLVGDQGVPGPGVDFSIYTVSLADGSRGILSSNTIPDGANQLSWPGAITLDGPGRALVAQPQTSAIMAVDLTTGARTVFTDPAVPNATNLPEQPRAIAVDVAGGRALVADSQLRALVAVNLTTGERTILSANEPNDIGARQFYSTGLALDLARNRLYVTDPLGRAVNAVNLATGTRTLVSTGGVAWWFPNDVVLDTPRNRLLVTDIDNRSLAVYAVDLGTGLRSVLSSNSIGGGPALVVPQMLALDGARNRVLVSDTIAQRVVAVDWTSGARTVLSGAGQGGVVLSNPWGIALDPAANRALVASPGNGTVITVDLDTGARGPFMTTQSGGAMSVGIDAATRTILLGDTFGSLHNADPGGGAFTVVSDGTRPRPEDHLKPRGIAIDGARKIAWVTNDDYAIPQIVDLVTGERVFLTR